MVRLMRVPKSIFRHVGDQWGVNKLMNNFFINVRDYLQDKLKDDKDFYFEIKSNNLENSDNIITYLEYKEKWVVAGMLETRTAYNNKQFTFFRDLSCLEEKVK
jgi:hypothetical protein